MAWDDIPSWSLDVASTIMQTVHVKDPETYFHCIRVGREARLLARAAGLNEFEQKVVEFSGLFHDVGKIGVPDAILLKPEKLTDQEYTVMKSHPAMSVQIVTPLTHMEFYRQLIPGILHHHERFDGKGYPHGVMGEEIPLAARMILIADTFDAMTADRSYRKGLAPEVALNELQVFAGRQFDPKLVKIYLDAKPSWKKEGEHLSDEMRATVHKINSGRKAA